MLPRMGRGTRQRLLDESALERRAVLRGVHHEQPLECVGACLAFAQELERNMEEPVVSLALRDGPARVVLGPGTCTRLLAERDEQFVELDRELRDLFGAVLVDVDPAALVQRAGTDQVAVSRER